MRVEVPEERVELFFDRRTGLLAKSQKQAPRLAQGADVEAYLSEYRKFDSAWIPMRLLVMKGKSVLFDVTVETVRFADKIDPDDFVLP